MTRRKCNDSSRTRGATNSRKGAVKVQLKNNSHIQPKNLEPMNARQLEVIDAYGEGKHPVLAGSAGTGKTLLAMSLALSSVLVEGDQKRVILVRSTVPTRDSGHLPGSLDEKNAIYELAYRSTCNEICGQGDAYEVLKKNGVIVFCSTSYLRGITLNDSVVIVDEVQNLTIEEISTVVTRLGKNSRLIICGDIQQSDLAIGNKRKEISGFHDLIAISKSIREFEVIWFSTADIVRSGIVKSWLIAKEKLAMSNR